MTSRRIVIAALAAACAACRGIDGGDRGDDASRRWVIHEAEEGADPAVVVESFTASGGQAVRIDGAQPSWSPQRPGEPALDATRAAKDARFWVRLAVDQRDRFEWRELPTATLTWQAGPPLHVDQWAWLPSGREPDPAASPPVWRSGELELRAAAGARVFDPEWILKLLRQQQDAVATLLGQPLPGPLLLVALPADEWPGEELGAFQNGRAIYLRDDELHLPWRSFGHELAHVFEEEAGVRLPRFLSEAMACRLETAASRATYDLGSANPDDGPLRRLAESGDEWHRPGATGTNPFFPWESPLPEGERERAYRWAGAFGLALEELAGPQVWARLHRELRDRRDLWASALDAGRSSHERAAAAVELLEAVAGPAVRELLRRLGHPDPDPGAAPPVRSGP